MHANTHNKQEILKERQTDRQTLKDLFSVPTHQDSQSPMGLMTMTPNNTSHNSASTVTPHHSWVQTV